MNKKEIKEFLNKERCPLCDSQLDGNIHPDRSILYCVSNNDHYKCTYNGMTLIHAILFLHFTKIAYQIISNKISDFKYKISLYTIDMTLNDIHREREKKKLLELDTAEKFGFNIRSLSEDKFLQKMKIYNIFS